MPDPHFSEDAGDEDFLERFANLNLDAVQAAQSDPPPYTPPRQPRTFTTVGNRINASTPIYQYDSPTRSGRTSEWSEAGAASQGVKDAHVRKIKTGKSKKKQSKKAAYVVFAGRECGVYESWRIAQPLVSGVSNSIFRGYATLAEAKAAFEYAEARSWTRLLESSAPNPPIPRLPIASPSGDNGNPLHGDEELDERWFVVYRGISPGVYRSHLECQLNTSGVSCATHESVVGRENAMNKFAEAVRCGDTAVLTLPYAG